MTCDRNGELGLRIKGTRTFAGTTTADQVEFMLVKYALDKGTCLLLALFFIQVEHVLPLPFGPFHEIAYFYCSHGPCQGALPEPVGFRQRRCFAFFLDSIEHL